jgi:hypothetical protein
MRSVRARVENLMGDAACLGAGLAYLVLLVYAATQGHPRWVALPERVLLEGLNTGFRLMFEPIELLVEHRGYRFLPILALALAWRRTRPVVAVALGALLFVECSRLAAFACFSVYVMDHALGLLSVPLALVPAAVARRGRWPILSIAVLAGGLCVGVAIGVLFQHDYPTTVSPLHRFVPTALVSLLGAWLISTRIADVDSSGVGRLVRLWGLSAVCVSCVIMIGIWTYQLRPRGAPRYRLPVSADGAYDLFLTGEPPQLIWTDTEQIHVLTNPYGASHETSYVLAGGDHRTPQRVWASPSDGFYIQMLGAIGWWKSSPHGEPLSPTPAVEFRDHLLQDGSPCGFAEDPVSRSVFTMSQWMSHYVVMDRDTGSVRRTGRVSTAFQAAWHATPALPSRIAYVSSALGDGGLYELNLDSWAITPKAPALYVYETVLDDAQHLLWGARPVTGEVVGVDSRTFDVRYRIHTEFGIRDVQHDPRTGALYTCSMYGHVFRVDVASQTAAEIAWCGRLCRNLFLDAQQNTLWAATDDGICRIPLAPGNAALPQP